MVRIHPSAEVATDATIGARSSIWHLTQIREHASLGEGCIVGRNVYIGPGVKLGNNCKVQNQALLYEPAVLEDGVFVGPSVVFTNDRFPRAVDPSGTLKGAGDWDAVGVTCRVGSSIGAGSVCVAPLTIGRWAMVAAGSVVVEDVPDFALVVGAPAKMVRWVGRAGVPLEPRDQEGLWECPKSGTLYREKNDRLVEETP